jgi:hypothetical protein
MYLTRCDECKKELSATELKVKVPREWPMTIQWMIGADMIFSGDACSDDCARRMLLKSINERLPPTKS